MIKIIQIFFYLFTASSIFLSCKKDDQLSKSSNYINVQIGNKVVSGKGMFPDLPFDEGNYFSLSNKEIGFTGIDCFHYGGSIEFNNNLSNIYGIGFNDLSCGWPYSVDSGCTNTYSTIEIKRNDNIVGGIIEGKIYGKCCVTTWNDTYYYNFDISFKLKIVE